MLKRRKNCSGTKGYNCGQTCISVKYVCKRDGLSAQSVNIAERLKEAINKIKANQPVINNGLFPSFDNIDIPDLPANPPPIPQVRKQPNLKLSQPRHH